MPWEQIRDCALDIVVSSTIYQDFHQNIISIINDDSPYCLISYSTIYQVYISGFYLCLKKGANIIITTIMMIVMIKQVMDFDTIGRNEMIGRLMLGCKYQE